MIIPDEIRKCVALIAMPMANGEQRFVGSAFFVSRAIVGTSSVWAYLVTAKHVIENIRKTGIEDAYIRLNWPGDESRWMPTRISDWIFHPTDSSVDVAALQVGLPDGCDHLHYPIALAASKEVISEQEIGLGTELFIVGLFSRHLGERKNIPIVRIGNIAAMPEEKISTPNGRIDAYLIEARSIGGLSGSPVFANLGKVRVHEGQLKFNPKTPTYFLLGLMHGHWDVDVSKPDATTEDAQQLARDIEKVNMGIGLVVPVAKIIEVITQPDLLEKQAVIEASISNQESA